MDQTLPACAEAERHNLGHRYKPRYFFCWLCDAAAWDENPQRHRMGETESAAESLLPLFHAFDRDNFVGFEEHGQQARFQLQADARGGGRQTNEKRLAYSRPHA